MSKDNSKARQNELVIQSLKDELLVYDLRIHKAYCLNETSALVWDLCDGNNSVSDIGRKLGRKLKSSISEDFVWLALDELKKENLLDNSQEINIKFDGLSRREVIRRVAFASMVVLPVISSLVAPTAAMAQSGAAPASTANCQPCTTDAQCVSGNCVNPNSFGPAVCSGGSSTTQALPSGSNNLPGVAPSDCSDNGAALCCSGSATFNGPGNCVCN